MISRPIINSAGDYRDFLTLKWEDHTFYSNEVQMKKCLPRTYDDTLILRIEDDGKERDL